MLLVKSIGDDSISFLSEIETPLNEAEVEIESENDLKIVNDVKKDVVHDLNNIVDLSKIDYNFIPTAKNTAKKTAKKTTTRKRSVRNQSRSLSTNEDLSVVDVLPPKRTRLKKAEVCYKPSSDDDITLGK